MLAHIKRDENSTVTATQTVAEHSRSAANYAAGCLESVGLAHAGYLAGLLHDVGKCRQEFQDYLLYGKGARGSVIHTFAGCRLILERFHGASCQSFRDVTAELLAYAVGAHHGLFDCVNEQKASGFLHRMTKDGIEFEDSVNNFLSQCAGLDEIDALFDKAQKELEPVYDKLKALHEHTGTENAFYLGLLARLLLSAVIEGDRRDTAEFMGDLSSPAFDEDMENFWARHLRHMEETLSGLPSDSPINAARSTISQRCRQFAERPGGVYRLNVPTGAGKTLAGLRYALAHAQRWKKQRIIFTAPLLSILDQNAAVIRKYIGDDSIILEHHSNVIRAEDDGERLNPLALAEDNWRAPVIITTLVQLLNTLFDGKTSCIRRFHSLCGSVIVIDEVQTVPSRMLSLFNLAVNFLSEICGATILLCSATQPALETLTHPIRKEPDELVPYEVALWEPFRRTNILSADSMNLDEIAAFTCEQLEEAGSVLVICNKKSEATYLFQHLTDTGAACFHLSAAMCMAHRRAVLSQIQTALEKQTPLICVATQVVEAGVDISFQRVIRLAAGMDSIVQSAGRCNRHGEAPEAAPVYIVQCKNEDLSRLVDIRNGKDASLALLNAYGRDPDRFRHDLTSDEAIAYYYRALYQKHLEGHHDYTTTEHGSLFNLLAGNIHYYDGHSKFFNRFMLNQAFKLAGDLFQVFDNETEDVVVPYGKGAELITELLSQGSSGDIPGLKNWLERAKPYTVSLYSHEIAALGSTLSNVSGVLLLSPGIYHEDTGFSLKTITQEFLEV